MRRALPFLGLLLASLPASASDYSFFPETDRIFHRLLADPRQVQTSGRYYRQAGDDLADIALGNSWGIVRWEGAGLGGWKLQWNVEGMAYTRFKLGGGINEFETIDFFGNLPFEARCGIFSGKLVLFHESSHLGDDYIRRTGNLGTRYSIEGLRAFASIEPHPLVRVYGGGGDLLHSVPSDQGGMLQFGIELRTPDFNSSTRYPKHLYLAEDVRWFDRVEYNPTMNTEIGIRIAYSGVIRSLRVHVGDSHGHSDFGQFYSRTENYYNFGISCDF